MENLRECFIKISNEYLNEKEKNFAKNSLGYFIRKDIPELIKNKINLDIKKYKVDGSCGQGGWAAVPWIAIFDKDITQSAQEGYYLVYLFDEKINKVYLSLNQGWTFYKKEFGKKKGSENIKKVSDKLKRKLLILKDRSYKDLEEISLGEGNLAKGYELGHICGVEYDLKTLPNENVLINDLINMLNIYLELKHLLYINDFSKIIESYILDDKLFITNEDELNFQVQESSSEEMEISPKKKLTPRISENEKIWPRDPSISKGAIEKANFLCEFDNNHQSFISDTTKKQYMEAHHLIPLNYQDEFENSLDVIGNIVSLCPTCHKKIHYGIFREKEKMLEKLYFERKKLLEKFGIEITLEELKEKYKK
ncbi:MrcB family domain-containing protein [Fusobacterium perfoetens]|uniref:MrcB family domain-containing protein n=1 Tax=Fusobacterium perfoetens TaxID=852 RepID=UPI0006850CD2|nr:DUF3578 domain-containing protein [Fusobacterium perfoetens]